MASSTTIAIIVAKAPATYSAAIAMVVVWTEAPKRTSTENSWPKASDIMTQKSISAGTSFTEAFETGNSITNIFNSFLTNRFLN